jgi:hypothetical protein
MEKIEVFELVIDTDDESGVTAIALVDQPAIESNWMAFSKQSEYKFHRRLLYGCRFTYPTNRREWRKVLC